MAFSVDVWKSISDTDKLSIKKKSYSAIATPFSSRNKKKSSKSDENTSPKEIQHKYIGFVTL
jgi:hypothetical protein